MDGDIKIVTLMTTTEINSLETEKAVNKPCCDCQRPLTGDEWVRCEACILKRTEADEKEQAAAAHAELVRKWLIICPPLYRSSDWSHAGLSPVCAGYAKNWWAGKDGMGLGLYGLTGKGKTRAMFDILKRHHFSGRKVFAVQSMEIEQAGQDKFADDPRVRDGARDTLRKCSSCFLLYIDDLGKEKMSERVAKEFHAIIEHRHRYFLPTLWTSEKTGDWLAQRLGDTYGDGLIRRFREKTVIRNVMGEVSP